MQVVPSSTNMHRLNQRHTSGAAALTLKHSPQSLKCKKETTLIKAHQSKETTGLPVSRWRTAQGVSCSPGSATTCVHASSGVHGSSAARHNVTPAGSLLFSTLGLISKLLCLAFRIRRQNSHSRLCFEAFAALPSTSRSPKRQRAPSFDASSVALSRAFGKQYRRSGARWSLWVV